MGDSPSFNLNFKVGEDGKIRITPTITIPQCQGLCQRPKPPPKPPCHCCKPKKPKPPSNPPGQCCNPKQHELKKQLHNRPSFPAKTDDEQLERNKLQQCFNCKNSDWTPPEGTQMVQCSRCKAVTYCSSICQLDHYNKVHKKHCKYAAGLKVKDGSQHTQETCVQCVKVKKARGKVGHLSSSVLPCGLAFATDELLHRLRNDPSLPVYGMAMNKKTKVKQIFLNKQDEIMAACWNFIPLWEVTGKFTCNYEMYVVVLMNLFLKLWESLKYEMGLETKQNMLMMMSMLFKARRVLWGLILVTPTKFEAESRNYGDVWQSGIHYLVRNLLTNMNDILKEQPDQKPPGLVEEKARPLISTILLVLNCFMLEAEGHWLTLDGRESEDHTKTVRKELMSGLSEELLPYSDLVQIVCSGNKMKSCDNCSKEVRISEVFPFTLTFWSDGASLPIPDQYSRMVAHEIPHAVFGTRVMYCCGDKVCSSTIIRERAPDFSQDTYDEFYRARSVKPFKCDYCYKLCSGRPRCPGCQAKTYCSVDCQTKDLDVHDLLCEEFAKSEWRKKSKMEGKERIYHFTDQFQRINKDKDEMRKRLDFLFADGWKDSNIQSALESLNKASLGDTEHTQDICHQSWDSNSR